MAVVKLLNLLAIACLATIASLGPAPVSAVSLENAHYVRHNSHHGALAKKRGTSSKRCKPRSTDPAPAKPTSYAPAPKPSKAPSNDGKGGDSGSSNNNNNGGGSGGSGPAKAGLAWPNGNDKSIQNFKTPKVDTYYTWSPYCVDYANDVGMQCCPMLWGWKQIGEFTKLVKPGYARCAMGPNEPNQAGQSDMSPESAVELWQKYIQPLKRQGYDTLVSPACTNAPSGKTWMKSFLEKCNGCSVDVVAAHFYGTDPQELIEFVTDLHTTFGKTIWITEFACQDFSGKNQQPDKDQVFNFVKTVTDWMDKTDYVHKYFMFGAMHDMSNVNPLNQLLGSNGQPTPLGQVYIGL